MRIANKNMVEIGGGVNESGCGVDNFGKPIDAAATANDAAESPFLPRNTFFPPQIAASHFSDHEVDDGIEVDAATDEIDADDVTALEDDVIGPIAIVGEYSAARPTLNLNVTHSDYALPQCSMASPNRLGGAGSAGQACSSEPVLSNNDYLFAAYCNGGATVGPILANRIDNKDLGKGPYTNAAYGRGYGTNKAPSGGVPNAENDPHDDDDLLISPLEDAPDPRRQKFSAAPASSNLANTAAVSNVKFAQATPPNSTVDMSSTDYLTGSNNGNMSNSNIRDSYSAKDHHAAVQNRYSRTRRRHFTDPVDFEGILRIIGGCGWWQLWIYILISLQQIPHAMFNLSVIYMMFKPDHWCYQEWFDPVKHDKFSGWTSEQIRNITAPLEFDTVHKKFKYSECSMYDRGPESYHDLSHMSFENASAIADTNLSGRACDKWTYDKSVMEDTIVSQWNLVCGNNFHRADAQLAYALGYFIGCLVSGLSSDRFGRKPTVIGYGVLASMFGMILPYSTYFPMFLLIRFLSAVCNEAADLAAYVLCMEITGTKYRSSVGSLLQLPWAFGYTLLALVAYLTKSWRTIQIITAAVHTITILFICVLPESPRWLIVNNRVREAEAIIRKACRMNNSHLPADLELVKHAEQRKWVKRNERANLLHLFKSYELVFRTLIIFIIWIATALVYYGISLNLSDQSAPGGKLFSGNFFVNSAVAGAVEIPTLLACCVILRYGRKRAQMVTLILAGIMMLGVVLSPGVGYLRLIFMLLGKMFIQGAFNILYIFTSELYPTVIRNSAVGTCSMVARMGAGVTGYLAILSDITLPIVPMIIFGVFSLVAGTMVVFLPETQDQPLPDTLQDAVIFLKSEKYPYCNLGGLANHKFSTCEDQSALNELRNMKNLPSQNDQLPETS